MSEIDPKGLRAAMEAGHGKPLYIPRDDEAWHIMEAGIAAYEAARETTQLGEQAWIYPENKASAVPGGVSAKCIEHGCFIQQEGIAPTRQAIDAVSARPSAVPDEVAETVRWIRSALDWSPQAQRAADMLERLASPPDEVRVIVERLRLYCLDSDGRPCSGGEAAGIDCDTCREAADLLERLANLPAGGIPAS
jgi:hypothetical protein